MDTVSVKDGDAPSVETLAVLRCLDVAAAGSSRPWNCARYCQASEDAAAATLLSGRRAITGFHSVGSRSVWASWKSLGIRRPGMDRTIFVGVIGGTMIRGDMGGDPGGVVVMVEEAIEAVVGNEADSGLHESLRRQLHGKS